MFKSKAGRANREPERQPVFKQNYTSGNHRTYSCAHCCAHLADHDELVSKLFQGNHGRAYLFNKVLNVGCRQAVQRELLTGLHAVADIYCAVCDTTLGWKYEQAFVPRQKYKEGKYIIEVVHMLKENDWDLTSYNTRELISESLDHLQHPSHAPTKASSAPAIAKWSQSRPSVGAPTEDRCGRNGSAGLDRQGARPDVAGSDAHKPNDLVAGERDQEELDKQAVANDRPNLGLLASGSSSSSSSSSQPECVELVGRTLREIQLHGGQRIGCHLQSTNNSNDSNGGSNIISVANNNSNNNGSKSDMNSDGSSDDSDHSNCVAANYTHTNNKFNSSHPAISTKSSLCSTCSQMGCLDSTSCSTSQMGSISVSEYP